MGREPGLGNRKRRVSATWVSPPDGNSWTRCGTRYRANRPFFLRASRWRFRMRATRLFARRSPSSIRRSSRATERTKTNVATNASDETPKEISLSDGPFPSGQKARDGEDEPRKGADEEDDRTRIGRVGHGGWENAFARAPFRLAPSDDRLQHVFVLLPLEVGGVIAFSAAKGELALVLRHFSSR